MSQLTSKFESETGLVAMYRKEGADYHTLRYVNWLEAAEEKFNSANLITCPACVSATKPIIRDSRHVCSCCGYEWDN
jgi:transposase-like protein